LIDIKPMRFDEYASRLPLFGLQPNPETRFSAIAARHGRIGMPDGF
jgi:hypothetical protein